MSPDGATAATSDPALLPAPWALGALAALGAVAVLVLPAVGAAMPWEVDPEPNATQAAMTACGVVLLTAGYVSTATRGTGWPRPAASLTFGYLAAISLVKFILSPASFHNTPGTTLSKYLWLGLVVLVLYLAGLTTIYRISLRHDDGQWPWPSRVATVVGALALAAASRYPAALVLGRDVGDYLGDAFRGGGLWLLALLAGSAWAAAESFDRPGRQLSLRVGAAVVVVYHGLWALYMLRLFD